MKHPLRIAFYGKGGIGKSTIACNIAALFAKNGKNVLQIGCDPKADSTRILTGGKTQSVLAQLLKKGHVEQEDILYKGKFGVYCVESGGPEAGNGCAGLGIITAIEELNRLEIFQHPWDVIIYDVLGDVVCGGFSVPMRQNYVDLVYVVSSSNFMSLYAANNILKGIQRYSDKDRNLLGGFILNHVRGTSDLTIGEKFTEKIGISVSATLIESRQIQTADFSGELFIEKDANGKNTKALEEFVKTIGTVTKCSSLWKPLSHEELECFGAEISRLELNL